jgi:hypothetical protein
VVAVRCPPASRGGASTSCGGQRRTSCRTSTEMEIGEADPTFLESQDMDENGLFDYRDSSYQEHDEDSGDDNYGKEKERHTLEDMLCIPEMLYSVENFYRQPKPHQQR